jgi:hypothetical protein
MTDSDRKLSEVPALIEERHRYEAWIAALDARRDSTPKHVFERVQSDYRERLHRVEEQIAAHRQSIQEEQASLDSRLSLLKAEEQLRRDERAELELRAHVGEVAGSEAEEAFRAVDEVIERLVGEKAELDRRVAALAGLLERRPSEPSSRAEPSAPAPAPAQATAPSAPTPASAATPPSGEKTERVEPGASKPSGDSFDELAFLNEVVGHKERPATAGQRTAPQAAPAPPAANQPPAGKAQPATAQPSNAPPAAAQAAATGKPSAPAMAAPDEPAMSESLLAGLGDAPRRPGERPFAANVPANTPIVLRTVTAAEQSKTLKCGECGTMNYPTEWYCERCGAELAAL